LLISLEDVFSDVNFSLVVVLIIGLILGVAIDVLCSPVGPKGEDWVGDSVTQQVFENRVDSAIHPTKDQALLT